MSDDAVKYDALVAKTIDSHKVILNKGALDGISTGDKFVVFGLGGEIHDPKTGESLGTLEEVKGKGEVTHLQDRMCTIETYEFEFETVPTLPLFFPFGPKERRVKTYRDFVGVYEGDYARKM